MKQKLNSGKGLKQSVVMTTAVVLGLIMLTPMVAMADSSANAGVVPPNMNIYEELSAKWWQWALEIPNKPESVHPILDTTGESCDVDQSGPVWFLAGTAGGQAERTCAIPRGKAILFPIINAATWIPTDGATKEEIKDAAKSLMDHVTIVEATVDDVALQDLMDYRFQSRFFKFTGPDDPEETIFAGQSGTHVAVADGFWILLAPLPAGQHTIHFRGVAPFPEYAFTFETEVTYSLTVN